MNNTIIGSVNQTYKRLDQKVLATITKDREVYSLDSHFKDSTSNEYSLVNKNAFVNSATIQFPEPVSMELECINHEYKMGFLSDISHVWITFGKVLFLWNYADNTDVFRYECSEPIGNVETIQTRGKTQLIVSTQNNLHIHGITYTNTKKLKITSSVTVTSNGVIYSNFIVSNNNRPFMQGDDGHLYELSITVTDEEKQPKICSIICHTASQILRFLPSFFKSAPEVPVKSMTMDKDQQTLLILLNDSSIHSVDIKGTQYLPLQRVSSTNLDSIHFIPSTDSKLVNVMAVSNKGDRLYYSSKRDSIDLVHTKTAPPLPAVDQAQESCEFSYFNLGIFATISRKSEEKLLVFTSIYSIEGLDSRVTHEDVYSELVKEKIWSVHDTSSKEALKYHHYAENLIFPKIPSREISTLSKSGITQYKKQRPVDYLTEVILENDPSSTQAFIAQYGPVETCALAFSLMCSDRITKDAAQFIHRAHYKGDALMLYVASVVEGIWTVDVLGKTIDQKIFKLTQERLEKLNTLLRQEKIDVDETHYEFVERIIEGIAFVCFIQNIEWNQVLESISSTSSQCTFNQLVTTEEGALLSRDIVLSAIKHSKLSNDTNDYNFISNFLADECKNFFGAHDLVYYRGMECLQGAYNDPENKQVLSSSLTHFRSLIPLIEIETLQLLAQEYCSLDYQIHGIELAYTKYQTNKLPQSSIFNVIFNCIKSALDNQDKPDHGKMTIEQTLDLTNEEQFHFKIYKWLRDNDRKSLLVQIESTLLEKYIREELPLAESLSCLRLYYVHRNRYDLAIASLIELATKVEDIKLESRVGCLKVATGYLPKIADEMTIEEKHRLLFTENEAKIQLSIHNKLVKSGERDAASRLEVDLEPATTLKEFAYTHSLYEDALELLHLMELYDWSYVKEAWTHIIEQHQEELKKKMQELSAQLYPSCSAFPVYVIYEILKSRESQYSKNFSRMVLVEAGIPEDVVLDAANASSDI